MLDLLDVDCSQISARSRFGKPGLPWEEPGLVDSGKTDKGRAVQHTMSTGQKAVGV